MISTGRKLLMGAPGALLGVLMSMHPLFKALLLLQAIDFVTGFLVAWSHGTVSSAASRRGFVKKTVALLLVLAVGVLAKAYQIEHDLAAMTAGWFCVTELISIAENAARAGWALPPFLTKALAAMRDKYEEQGK